MSNGDLPAMAIEISGHGYYDRQIYLGLTKREMFCLYHGVAATGDAELDAIIVKGNMQKASMAAMQGILSNGVDFTLHEDKDVAKAAVTHADNLLAELELTK